jgi:hypothetical protein
MPQQQQRSEIWWRGHNDALAGDPPNESYYHYYYDYKLAYDKTRREQRRNQRQRTLTNLGRRIVRFWPVVLIALGLLGYGGWRLYQPEPPAVTQAVAVPTRTPRPTPRPTLTPIPPTPEPVLRPEGFAVITGTDGATLIGRSAPGKSAKIQTRFREGETVRILEGPQSADDLEWWRIEAGDTSGWAAAPFLKPIEAPPASPAP